MKSYEKQILRSLESATTSQIDELEKALKVVARRLEIENQNKRNKIINDKLVNWHRQWSNKEFDSNPGFFPMNYTGTV